MKSKSLSLDILIFLTFVLAISTPFAVLIIHAHSVEIDHGRVIHMLMWAPALAAFATCAVRKIDIASLGWRWKPVRFEVIAYTTPIVYGLLAYVPLWLTGAGHLELNGFLTNAAASLHFLHVPRPITLLVELGFLGTFGVIQSLASALGEEIGWRGFLLPRLVERFGFGAAVVLSGIIWAAWHVPVLLGADYNAGTPFWWGFSCFAVMILFTGLISAWLRMRSGSLWPAALFHATHNALIQWVLDPMTGNTRRTPYWSGEFGLFLAVSSILVAVPFWLSYRSRQQTSGGHEFS